MTSISFESEKRLFTIELEESKYFVKLYFISHYKAEIFLRLLSSVHKWFLIYYLCNCKCIWLIFYSVYGINLNIPACVLRVRMLLSVAQLNNSGAKG